jgi:L-seryl-tRNA(Ser) seleniumtransferase
MTSSREIPSIDRLLQRPSQRRAAADHGRDETTAATREAAAELRAAMTAGERVAESADAMADWIDRRVETLLADRVTPSLARVINATGVIIHTNLGRAPLAAEAADRAAAIASGYSNLEYDLASGSRGHRHVHAERLLCDLTGAEAAAVVNNNAAATLLVLAALAAGREVIVSRGELVEIGGGFRVPDVMAQSGAVLREVGTTNRTRVADYAAAISDRTALVLRVHPSNFRVEGFAERPLLADLTALSHRLHLPLFEDLGSGWLDLEAAKPAGLDDEPGVGASLRAGADLVAFSGDKLLGGPQSGLIVGRRDLVDRVRRHPLMRALRADKLTYAALERTLALWARAPARTRIPVYRMLSMTADEIERRAAAILDQLRTSPSLRCSIVDGVSTIGGGSAPGSALATRLIALSADGLSSEKLDARLRESTPPVIARIQDDRVVIDLRTVDAGDDAAVVEALRRAARPETA